MYVTPLPFLQYSSIPHLQNPVFNKHWGILKYLKALFDKIHQNAHSPIPSQVIDPFFYVLMSHKYHLCIICCLRALKLHVEND